jgi:Excreted virulence factor EspC, type VII ESX diderm
MQVDTGQLRTAAAQLRQDVVQQLTRAQRIGWDVPVAASPASGGTTTFDTYTTAAPYTEAANAWLAELGVLLRATTQLADALERAAEGYDRSDARAVRRLRAPR